MNIKLYYIVIIVVLMSGCLNALSTPPQDSDFDVIIKPPLEELNDGFYASSLGYPQGKILYRSSLEIVSDRDDLYYRVYDSDGVEGNMHRAFKKDETYSYAVYLDYLTQRKQIKVYASTKSDFTDKTKGVVFKTVELESPNVDMSISPATLTFTTSKSSDAWGYYDPITPKEITVTNMGDRGMYFYRYFPSSDYSQEPHYNLDFNVGTVGKYHIGWLNPEESFIMKISPEAYDSNSPGTYKKIGYIYVLSADGTLNDAQFKKPFYVETTLYG